MSDALRAAVADLLDRADERSEGVLPIVQAGAPVLRAPAARYDGQLGDLLPRLVEAMRRTMRAAPGVGLAAPQVGISLAIAVVEDAGTVDDDPRERTAVPFRVLVNPRYEPLPGPAGGGAGAERVAFFEGCLSVAGWSAVVARHRRVRLTGTDEAGEPVDEVLTGWPARIVQHETDHLAGELYLDHAETRSLTSNENLARYWAASPDPAPAAAGLGFALPVARGDS
ncbi:peptide deformylase [Isoptericola cucumis]|uniref:Peptide deformylase n=1 Tax=Isoptericola cucumis TaxID=1776856 RepID=A0ABQ2BBC7_9MICO|nr:peptide deformylase [Isoptericola cucumis]GGI10088.1 peptide deformylase 1 [Isoptericola cucumis]